MIAPDALLSIIQRLPLFSLRFFEAQPRYFDPLKHYYDLMTRSENADKAPGFTAGGRHQRGVGRASSRLCPRHDGAG